MSIHINDLCCDLLTYLFNFLPNKQLFVIEFVCKKWKVSANRLMKKRITELNLDDYGRYFQIDTLKDYTSWWCTIDDNNINYVYTILSKCPNIKHLDLVGTFVSVNHLIAIANSCPKLECISFGHIKIELKEWEKFARMFGPKLIQVNFYFITKEFNSNLYMTIMFSQAKNLEEVIFGTDDKESARQLFSQLNLCKDLKKIEWRRARYHHLDLSNENMIKVMQRINFLDIDAYYFEQFNFEMKNLTELILNDWVKVHFNDKFKMTLPNLVKLTLKGYIDSKYSFANMKFPQLKHLSVYNVIERKEIHSFLRQNNQIECFECFGCSFKMDTILMLKNLVNFNYDFFIFTKDHLNYFVESINVFSKHKSLQNIKLTVNDSFLLSDFFDELIKFQKLMKQIKPNCHIEILIKCYKYEVSSKYKKNYEETRHLTKANLQTKQY